MAREATTVGERGVEADAAYASQSQLIWWRFRRHRMAVVGGIVVLLFYLVALCADVIAPRDPLQISPRHTYAPPQTIHFFDRDASGSLIFAPYVNGYKIEIERRARRRVFVADPEVKHRIGLFVRSEPYEVLGLFPASRKLIGPINQSDPFFLMGADRLGRDLFSRTVHGARISMSIGLVGVTLSLLFGLLLGGLSGYYGGTTDHVIQRVIEFILSLPTIPLWLGLAAAFPQNWSPILQYFCITLILSLIGWTSLARVVRGRFLSLRSEDFVVAARLDGASEIRVILRHMIPSIISHVIAAVSLAIPAMILAETALSFLGLGLQPPIVSWGVLLQEAQSIRAVATAPWLFAPGIAVVVAVLSLNFLGDGLRDAADPYGQRT